MIIINYTDTNNDGLIKFKPKQEIDIDAKMNELAQRGVYADFYNSKGELVASSKKKETTTIDNLYTGDPYAVGNSTSKSNDYSQFLPTTTESEKKNSVNNTVFPTESPGTIDANNLGKITSQATQGATNKGNSSSWQNQDKTLLQTGNKTQSGVFDMPTTQTGNAEKTTKEMPLTITYPPYMTKKKNSTSRAGLARQNVTDILKQTKGDNDDILHVFDGIDDEAIERNFPFAEEAVELSKKRNTYGAEENPYKTDALALMYAADEKGDKTAVEAAKDVAYVRNLKGTLETPRFDDLVLKSGNMSELEKFDNTVGKTTKEAKNDGNFCNIVKSGIDKVTSNIDIPAIDAIENIYDTFTGEDKLLSGISAAFDLLRASNIPGSKIAKNIARGIWHTGAEVYLRQEKKYNVSADLLEHSLQENPKDLVFYDNSKIAQAMQNDEKFVEHILELADKIADNVSLSSGDNSYRFTKGDLFFSINNCNVNVLDVMPQPDGAKEITVHISDTYDFTKIWTMMNGNKFGLGALANDAGVVSTLVDAINPYKVDVYFTIKG